MFFGEPIFGSFSHYILLVLEQEDIKEPLIYPAAHLRHIFPRLLLAEKLDVHPVHLAFFAIADEIICTESAPPHSISVSLSKLNSTAESLLWILLFVN